MPASFSWPSRPARAELPTDVTVALLSTLFTRTTSLVVSAVAGLVVSIAVFMRTGSGWAVAWSIADVMVLVARLVLIRAYSRAPPARIRAEVGRWARAYMIGGIISSTMLGFGCFFCLLLQDQTISLLSLTVVTGTAGGLSSRNAALPRFAVVQIVLSLLPVAAGAALGGDRWYLFLVAEILFYILALRSIVRRNYQQIEGLMLMERANAHMARHDALTGLANRARLMSGLADSLAALAGRPDAGVAVLYLDLDGFKGVNDTLGHAAGDALLRLMAGRLSETAGPEDLVARLGGDEFAVIQPGGTIETAAALAQCLVDALSGPQELGLERRVRSGVSVGIARAPEHGLDADALLARADMALYAAKAAGKGRYRLFEPAMEEQVSTRRALEQDLRDALAEGGAGLTLHYQPIVDLATRRVVAREALVRWQHPTEGALPPLRFIPLAEETGLIVPLGQWVVERACRDAVRWADGVPVAVNISPAQLGEDRDLPAEVAAALAAAGLPAARLEIEITESVLLRDDPRTLSQLHLIATSGVGVALDDFGTGYSSLAHLRAFPFGKIKIDGSFVRDATEGSESAAIVHALADLGARLDVATVAEGIETEAQLALVRREGCVLGQGYLFGRPEPTEAIAEREECL